MNALMDWYDAFDGGSAYPFDGDDESDDEPTYDPNDGFALTFDKPAYLSASFRQKDEVKALGAWWDPDKKSWYVPRGRDCRPFLPWSPRIDGSLVTQRTSTNGSRGEVDAQATKFGRPVYLDCPYREKDEAKELGARWDPEEGSWYVVPGDDVRPFSRWSPRIDGRRVALTLTTPSCHKSKGKERLNRNHESHNFWLYLDVPYREKDSARSLGARWDMESKKWYVPPGYDVTLFARWSDTAAAVAAGKIGRAIMKADFSYMGAVERVAVVDSWRRMAGVQESQPRKKKARRESRSREKPEKKSSSAKADTSGEARVEAKLEPKSDEPKASLTSVEETPLGDAKMVAKMDEPNESLLSCGPSKDNSREKCYVKEEDRNKSDEKGSGVSNNETVESVDAQRKLATVVVTPEKKRSRPNEEEEDGWV